MATTVKKFRPTKVALRLSLDAVAELVHQGFGRLLDVSPLYEAFEHLWEVDDSEYIFVWNPEIDDIEVNWKRPNKDIVRRVVKRAGRAAKVLSGTAMTEKEQAAYRVELARKKHGYVSAREGLVSRAGCKWVELSHVTDRQGRPVYIIGLEEALRADGDDGPELRHSNWFTFWGPFRSRDEAERWMENNGAFDEVS